MSSANTTPNINPLELYTKNQLCSISANMWSRPATALLIELYRKLECLWKTNSVYYRNKKKRYEALQEIATAIAPFRPDTTVEDVKNKINGIRTQYVAEKNKISFYAKKNPPMEYEPSLWCYDRLSFLAAYTSLKTKPAAVAEENMVIADEDSGNEGKQVVRIKIEDDEIEFIETEDNITSENNEQCVSSQQPEDQYLNKEPCPKKAKISIDTKNVLDKTLLSSIQPEVTLTKCITPSHSSEEFVERVEESHSAQSKSDESLTSTENYDWIEIFGKFVTTQMKLITNKTLLIKLQHTIQSAIIDAQLKQIELDKLQ